MSVNPGWTRKRRHKILLGVFVLLGLLAGAGYAVLKPPMLTSTALVALPPATHDMATQAVIADSSPVLASSLRRIRSGVSLSTLRSRTQAKGVTSNILSVTAQGATAAAAEGAANAVATSYVAYVSDKRSAAGSVQARVLEPATSTTGPSLTGNLLLMGWIGALAGLLIGAIVAVAVSHCTQTTRAPAA
jgi:capsular polysaccharide biosynthesis protein